MTSPLNIEIAHQQTLLTCTVPEGTTVESAILQSHILDQFPEINLQHNKVGIFGKVVPLSHILHDQDRIEIYQPLLIDPKLSRKLKGAKT